MYIYTYLYVYICTYIYIFIRIFICVYMYIYIHTYMYIYVHIYTYLYVHIYTLYVHIHIYITSSSIDYCLILLTHEVSSFHCFYFCFTYMNLKTLMQKIKSSQMKYHTINVNTKQKDKTSKIYPNRNEPIS